MQFIAAIASAEGISARDQKHGTQITKSSKFEGHFMQIYRR